MFKKFDLNLKRFIIAIILMLLGTAFIIILSKTELVIGGRNLTSIGIILSGLLFYSGILVILAMFENETVLSVGILMPSIVAVGDICLWFHWLVSKSLIK